MMAPRKTLRSDMGWSSADRIVVRGLDLPNEILGKLNLGDFAFLEIKGRVPTTVESTVFNAMLATLVEHGMTPMAIAARLTYLGAPESLQAAVAAGLCGMGSTFAGTAEGSARMLQEALPIAERAPDLSGDSSANLSADSRTNPPSDRTTHSPAPLLNELPSNLPDRSRSLSTELPGQLSAQLRPQLPPIAARIVADHIARKKPIPGIGHPLHKPVDPRTPRLFEIAKQNGLAGNYVQLMALVAAEAEHALSKPGELPVNATGALGALASELAISWRLCRGLAVIGRAVGLVGHLAEELRNPLAREIWERIEHESSSHARS